MLDSELADLDDEARAAILSRVTEALWRRGNLRYKLDPTQLKILAQFEGSSQRKFFLLCSRRLGKSFTLVVLSFMRALQTPGARILFLAPFAKNADEIATDIAAQVMRDMPGDMRPEYKSQAKELHFRNGSVIRFKGVNSEAAQYLRGGMAHLIVLDECGTMDDLKHVVSDVCMPMTMTCNGRILLATTPARSPGHDSAHIYEQLAQAGAVARFTLLDNTRVSPQVMAEYLRETGETDEHIPSVLAGLALPKTTTSLREYFVEWVTDAASAVLPEFTEEAQAEIVKSTPRPPYFDAYVALDPGMRDNTGILYAIYDFKRGKIVVEDEAMLQAASTYTIADELLAREHALWGENKPYIRVSDVDLRLITDLWERHGLMFQAAEKQDSLGAINLVRNLIQARELEINPRCVNLIRQMKNAIWNNKATDFARAGEQSPDKHYDLVAALKYLCRTVNRHRNPYPPGFRHRPDGVFFSPRSRFWDKSNQLGLLDNTPLGRRLAKRKG